MNNTDKIMEILGGDLGRVRDQLDPGLVLCALGAALAAAIAASLLYRLFYERRGTGSKVHRAFPLLALSITTLFIGVQISIPLSLGLLGSLSIIRFRTPIKEPEEVGFIMLVIAASIAAATFNFALIAYLYAGAFLCLLAMRGASAWRYLRRDGLLVLALDAAEATAKFRDIEALLDGKTRRHILESSSTRSGQTTYQYVFSGLSGDVAELQSALSALAPFTSVNIFLDRPGGIR
jgi:hypothetical protein